MLPPFLADMPPLFSSQPLPPCLAVARAGWRAAMRTARTDLPRAAHAFLEVAAQLAPAATDALAGAITSMRLVALENALDAASAAGDRLAMERELSLLLWSEPELSEGVARLLRGERESRPAGELETVARAA